MAKQDVGGSSRSLVFFLVLSFQVSAQAMSAQSVDLLNQAQAKSQTDLRQLQTLILPLDKRVCALYKKCSKVASK